MLQNFWIGTDFTKLLSSLPPSDAALKSLLQTQQRNLKALEEANQHAIDAFHSLFARQNEVLHATLDEIHTAMTQLSGQSGPDVLARQTALATAATEKTLSHLRDMSELVAQASQKAGQVLGDRLQESLRELHALGQPNRKADE